MSDYANPKYQRMMATDKRLYGGTAGRRKRGEHEPDKQQEPVDGLPDISQWQHFTPAQLETLRRKRAARKYKGKAT